MVITLACDWLLVYHVLVIGCWSNICLLGIGCWSTRACLLLSVGLHVLDCERLLDYTYLFGISCWSTRILAWNWLLVYTYWRMIGCWSTRAFLWLAIAQTCGCLWLAIGPTCACLWLAVGIHVLACDWLLV